MVAIHQFVHSYVDYDATATHARHLQRIIREMGYESEVFAGEWRGKLSKAAGFREYRGGADVLLYQFATASPLAAFLKERSEQLVLNYHNITPYDLIAPWEPMTAPELTIARQQLQQLNTRTSLAIGVSGYNAAELNDYGFSHTSIAPVLFDPEEFSEEIDPAKDRELKAQKDADTLDILFVGRLAPHKCQHDLIAGLAAYLHAYGGKARLHLVGGISSHRYYSVLQKYAETLGIRHAVNLTKSVSAGELGAYYANADVFTCVSMHEGFGVPMLEAMHQGLPVVAFGAAAIPETLGAGGLLLHDKSPSTLAATWHRLARDEKLRTELVSRGESRIADFALKNTQGRWQEIIAQLVEAS